jgi:hypothetical protein
VAKLALRINHGHTGKDAVTTPREELQAVLCRSTIFRLWQNPPPNTDNRVRGQHDLSWMVRGDFLRFLTRQTQGVSAGQLARNRVFINVSRDNLRRRQANRREKIATARTRTGQDEIAHPGAGLFEAVGNPTLGQVVRRHLNRDAVTREHANTVFAHPASRMGNDLVIVHEFDAKGRVREEFDDFAFEFQEFFFSQA